MKWIKHIVIALVLTVIGFWAVGWMKRSGPHEYAKVDAATIERSKAYLDENLRSLPEGWEWSMFEPEPGVALRVGGVKGEGSKGTVVIVPGYTAPIELYSEEARAFREAGYDVAGFEYRGQGLSARDLPNPEMGTVESWERLGQDLGAYIAKLKADGAGDVFVYANSMGAHVSLRAAGETNPDVAGYVLTVPMVKINTGAFPYGVAGAITRFYSATGMDGEFTEGQVPWKPDRIKWGEGNDCNPNPKTAWLRDALFALQEPLRVSGTTNGWVVRTMASSEKLLDHDFAQTFEKPILMFTAGKESFVDSEAAGRMCSAMKACERVHYPESSHCIAQEKPEVRAEIFAKSLAFMEANASR